MDDVKLSLCNQLENLYNYIVIQLNSLRKWLGDLIEPILAPTLDKDRLRYTIGKGFPSWVKDFQRLVLDPTTLLKLIKYYLV